MTAQPNDRAVEWLAEAMHDLTWQGRQTPPGRSRALAVTALAAIRDALARGGDDADAIAQAIGLTVEERWTPISESGDRWAPRSLARAESAMRDYPAGGCWRADDPWDGVARIEHERRYVTEWRGAES